MNIPKAILFDLDDTILAFSNASMLAWKKCCDEFVIKNNVDFDGTQLYDKVMATRKWYWSDPEQNRKGRADMKNARREVFGFALKAFNFKYERKIIETADSYSIIQESLWALFDGLPEAFVLLQSKTMEAS